MTKLSILAAFWVFFPLITITSALKYDDGFQITTGNAKQIKDMHNCLNDLGVKTLLVSPYVLESTLNSQISKANYIAQCGVWKRQAEYLEFKTIPNDPDQMGLVELFLKGHKLPFKMTRPDCGGPPCVQYRIKTVDFDKWNRLFCQENGLVVCE